MYCKCIILSMYCIWEKSIFKLVWIWISKFQNVHIWIIHTQYMLNIYWKLLFSKYAIYTAIYKTFTVWRCTGVLNVWLVLVLYFAGRRSWISTTDPAWPPTVRPLVIDLWPSTSPPTFVRTLYRSPSTGPAFRSQPLSHCKALSEL